MVTMSRHDALRLEAPEMASPRRPKDLHFVGDADAAGGPDAAIDFGQVAVRKDDLPAAAQERLGDVAGRLAPLLRIAAMAASASPA